MAGDRIPARSRPEKGKLGEILLRFTKKLMIFIKNFWSKNIFRDREKMMTEIFENPKISIMVFENPKLQNFTFWIFGFSTIIIENLRF